MKQPTLLQRLTPFLGLGIMIGFFIIALVFLSYVFVIGALIGLALFTFAWIRSLFIKKKAGPQGQPENAPHIGNVYDHDEFK